MRANDDELRELQAHVDKLVEILDEANPCNENCDLAGVQAWVNPVDRERVSALRWIVREERDALRQAIELFCPDVAAALAWVDIRLSLAKSGTRARRT